MGKKGACLIDYSGYDQRPPGNTQTAVPASRPQDGKPERERKYTADEKKRHHERA